MNLYQEIREDLIRIEQEKWYKQNNKEMSALDDIQVEKLLLKVWRNVHKLLEEQDWRLNTLIHR